MPISYEKTGYLHDQYRIFYLQNSEKKTIPYHYHDFHKILLFLQGNISYIIEGKQYDLESGDIVLVPAGEIHRPLIHDSGNYERMIFYISSSFFDQYQKEGYDLFQCFNQSLKSGSRLIRQNHQHLLIPLTERKGTSYLDYFQYDTSPTAMFFQAARELALSFKTPQYCNSLYQRSKFLEMMILLSGMQEQDHLKYSMPITGNTTIQQVLQFINDHLSEEDLNIDRIAEAIFLNRSYLMHLFRQETGYTIGNYISDKRLFFAETLIREGHSVTDACYEAGFRNYSAFYYAYKKKYRSKPDTGTVHLVNQ